MKFNTLKKSPLRKARILAFTRYIKPLITGSTGKKPESALVANKFNDALVANQPIFDFPRENNAISYDIPSSTWEGWWRGESPPSIHIEKFNAMYCCAYDMWFDRGNYSSRLALHFSALELAVVKEIYGVEKAIEESGFILQAIANEWMPRKNTIYLSLAPCCSTDLAHSEVKLPAEALSFYSSVFGINKKQGKEALERKAQSKTLDLFSVITPASIIPFLLRHLLTKCPSEKGAIDALIIDMLTACIAVNMIFKCFFRKGAEYSPPYKQIVSFLYEYFGGGIVEYTNKRHSHAHPLITRFEDVLSQLEIEPNELALEELDFEGWKAGYLKHFSDLGLSNSEVKELLKTGLKR